MHPTARRVLVIWNWFTLAAFLVGCVWFFVLLVGGPHDVPRDEVNFIAAVICIPTLLLGTCFVLFRRARRPTCTWPRWWRRLAQAPGWFLVVLGVYVVIGLAVMEIREKRVGLGTGTLAAAGSALLKAIADRYGRPEDS